MSAYIPILVTAISTALLIGAAYLLSRFATGGALPHDGGVSLAGNRPRQHAMSRFHVRWYLVALLFLAFDMEMVFMYPWAVVVADIGLMALIEMGMFLLILLLGVLYAWREGALRWT